MPPNKGKKGKKFNIDDDDGEDIKLGDIPEPTAAAAKPKAPAPKKQKAKKKPVAGDWSDDEDAEIQEPSVVDNDEAQEVPPAVPRAPAAAYTFALLQDGADEELEEEEEEEEGGGRNDSTGSDAGAGGKADEHFDGESASAKGIVCAEVTSISKHPNADRLRICQLNAGSKSLQVVTNAPNIKEGMRTALALDGAQTPGSNIAVAATTVRGSKSFGMICSAYDLGWMDAQNGLAVRLPQDMKLGAPLNSTAPEKAEFRAEEDEEPAASQASKKSSKKKKGKDSRSAGVANAFEALGLEDEGSPADAEEDSAAVSKQEESAAGTADAAEQEGVAAVKPKGRKKKSKVDIGSAFAALGLEDDADSTAPNMNGDSHGSDIAYSKANGHAAAAEEIAAVDHAKPEPESVKLNGKKRQKKKSSTDVDALLASMGEAPASPEQEVDGESPEDTAASKQKETKKKKKDRKHGGDVDALLAQLNDSAAPQEPASEAAAETQQEAEQDPAAASKSKKPKKDKEASKGADEDINALLAEIGGDSSGSKAEQPSSQAAPAEREAEASAPASEPAADEAAGAKAQSKKNKKNKKGNQDKQEVEDDLDAILAELDGKPPPAQQSGATGTAAGAAPAEEAMTTEPADASEATGELSAAAKKKLKKKAKEKAKKVGGAAEEPAEANDEAPATAPAAKKGGKKVSAAVRRMQEALERQEREAAEAAQREAERRAAEEEAARKAAEEEERLAAEREQRKAERAARRAEAKRQGLLLTGKAKKEAERLAMLREQLLRNSGVDVAGTSPREDGEKPAPKKIVYGKKKPAKKEPASGDAADKTAEEEQAALAERQAAEEAANREQEEEARKAAEEAERARQEEVAAQAAAVEPEESEDDMNWEDMDLDAVKLPGTKKEEPPAPEPAKRPAKEDDAAEAPAAAVKKQRQAPEANAAEKQEDKEDEEEEEDEEDEDEESEEGSEDESEEESSEEESSDEDSSSYESSSVDSEEEREERLARQKEMREARLKAAMASGSRDHLRSPICCILGHVDTGKTKLLDNVRRTSVQEGEAGGITQQIGATYVPGEAIAARTESLRQGKEFEMKMPGLLIIDTPGHESFTNLRSRGSGLCDIAILVVDLMHGLEPQTVESIGLLKMRKTPFIIALNKVDRLYAWKSTKDAPMQESLDKQSKHTMSEFQERMKKSMLDLNEQGLNVALYWENPDIRKYVNIVPTSAITGEGIPDLLQLLVKLTQAMMAQRLMFISELQCTVLEVKVIEGLGTTIDVVLVNGVLHEGDQIVVCGLNGAIVTSIRSLLTPHPLKELRVKGSYLHHKEITAAQGVKIAAPGLENAVAGTQLLVVGKGDDVSLLKEEVMQDMESIFDSVDRSGEGVCVQASTLGSLEALLEFLRSQEAIPVSSIAIGPIHRKDVMRAKVMLEKGCKKYGIILAFDVPVTREAQELADKEGVRIMRADIIYHLFDQFTAYCKEVKEHEQEAAKLDAVFPCILKILPTCVFNKKDPIVVGADVVEGIAKVGTPLCIPSQGGMDLGRIASMEINHVAVDKAKRGDTVALKVEATNTAESSRLYGRHFDHKDDLVSRISRKSIDLLKQHFKDELGKDDWRLVLKLKKVFNID